MNPTLQGFLVGLAFVVGLVAAGFVAYNAGLLDPIIEKIGVMLFKAKGMAEAKNLQARGLKAGDDVVDGQMEGNKQAQDVMEGAGSIGGLKKEL
ncbi:hypothetical protein MKZ38_003600 [Zalerion maritima]|uniref:Uncharacterized protein n=1 Tax=Zalerion maritima TaxID=339359 RepID=A0AAD5RP11_9PEZI|nr:hypothetical protein MKZ38_003600 [Zalerion maritima]